jgi:excisionase family DNA binding protein
MTYGIKDLCERFAVGEHTILQWIHRGELRAINVARRPGGRPKWRVTAEALEAFEALRTPVPTVPRASRRRRGRAAEVLDIIK